jgi:ribosome assembly protein 1
MISCLNQIVKKRNRKTFKSKGQKPMFVQFILENIWSVYEAVIIRRFEFRIFNSMTIFSFSI